MLKCTDVWTHPETSGTTAEPAHLMDQMNHKLGSIYHMLLASLNGRWAMNPLKGHLVRGACLICISMFWSSGWYRFEGLGFCSSRVGGLRVPGPPKYQK